MAAFGNVCRLFYSQFKEKKTMLFTSFLSPEKCGDKTAYEVFKQKKLSLGNRWSKVLLSFRRERKNVWFSSLEDAYMNLAVLCDDGLYLPVRSYFRENGDAIRIYNNDIIPHDGTHGQIRYELRTENERGASYKFYRAKVGKIVREYLNSERFNKFYHVDLTNTLIDYLCEEASARLNAYNLNNAKGYNLVVDDDFQKIYSTDHTLENSTFGSCQMDKELWDMWPNIKGAKAIYVTNDDDEIVARAIYFTEIHVENDDKVYRGIERIYSYNSEEKYKKLLLMMARKEGIVDIFKDINAGAYDTKLWRIVKGEEDEEFQEDMYVECIKKFTDESVAWGDSFKYYNEKTLCIYNYAYSNDDIVLDNYDRDVTFEDLLDRWYDGYSDCWRYTREDSAFTVFYHGNEIETTECNKENYFTYVSYLDEYHYNDDVVEDYKGNYILKSDAEWSDYYDGYIRDEYAEYSEYHNDYIDSRRMVKVYTDYANNEYEEVDKGCDDIVLCSDGYYIFEDNAVYSNGQYHDKTLMALESEPA